MRTYPLHYNAVISLQLSHVTLWHFTLVNDVDPLFALILLNTYSVGEGYLDFVLIKGPKKQNKWIIIIDAIYIDVNVDTSVI